MPRYTSLGYQEKAKGGNIYPRVSTAKDVALAVNPLSKIMQLKVYQAVKILKIDYLFNQSTPTACLAYSRPFCSKKNTQ